MSFYLNGMYYGKLSPDTTVGGCIDIFENVWPDPTETIKSIEAEVENKNSGVYWERASTVDSGAFQSARTNKMLGITHFASLVDNKICQNIHNQFNVLLMSASVHYAEKYKINEQLWHEPYNFLKYEGGEEYKSHYDGNSFLKRTISAICYLNNDFEGGEIEFVHQKVKIKPQPGMLILFPSNYAYSHIAHPVTSGTKYAIVTWIRDSNG